jgi:hypothetical protein
MKSLDINLMFWTDNQPESTRFRNVKYAISELKNLTEYLNNFIKCNYYIYDYSPEKIIEESIHIPYPPSVYKRSEKINNILNNTTSDLISIIDSDCFICREDYEQLAKLITESPTETCFTFDVLDLNSPDVDKIIKENANPLNFECTSRFPGRSGGLGAFFITNTKNLKSHNGFNTNFTTWGGEDGEIYDKIFNDGTIVKKRCTRDVLRLFHLPHFSDRENINYFNREEYTINNLSKLK